MLHALEEKGISIRVASPKLVMEEVSCHCYYMFHSPVHSCIRIQDNGHWVTALFIVLVPPMSVELNSLHKGCSFVFKNIVWNIFVKFSCISLWPYKI